METYLLSKGYEVKHTKADAFTDVNAELEKHTWADTIIIQMPMNWMGVPWTMKKYIDEVYIGGMQGKLCKNDGHSSASPKVIMLVVVCSIATNICFLSQRMSLKKHSMSLKNTFFKVKN